VSEGYTTGTEILDLFVRLARAALPELNGRAIKAYQRQADAPTPEEPYAAIALSPTGPVGHPEKRYPYEAGTRDATTGAAPIRQTIEVRHSGSVSVAIFGDDALELCELLDSRIHGEECAAILSSLPFTLAYSPARVTDETALDGDRWRPAVVRTYGVAWTRQDECQARAIESITTSPPVLV
jgi:hypothetical protein